MALASYRDQLRDLLDRVGAGAIDLAGVCWPCPGVVEERKPAPDDPHDDWPALGRVVIRGARRAPGRPGRGGPGDGRGAAWPWAGRSASDLARIAERGPEVVASYQKRLTERVQALVQDQGVTIEPKDLIREVAIFAERADIAEEIVRLRAHLAQYVEVIHEPESSGRKLEFVVQEMGRETNTIGSKANDVEISRRSSRSRGCWRRSAS